MDTNPEPTRNPDYRTLFAKVTEAGNVQLLETVRQIDRQAETVRMIAQAVEQQSGPGHVVTYLSV